LIRLAPRVGADAMTVRANDIALTHFV
jgi:hypothetical protein